MKSSIKNLSRVLLLVWFMLNQVSSVQAATGELGTGIPVFGVFTNALNGTGGWITIWLLKNPTINFPQGCSTLYIMPGTQGASSYKDALAILLTAVSLNKPVRFYSHAERDGGCGVDYLQIVH
jgi:hypothetical protein